MYLVMWRYFRIKHFTRGKRRWVACFYGAPATNSGSSAGFLFCTSSDERAVRNKAALIKRPCSDGHWRSECLIEHRKTLLLSRFTSVEGTAAQLLRGKINMGASTHSKADGRVLLGLTDLLALLPHAAGPSFRKKE